MHVDDVHLLTFCAMIQQTFMAQSVASKLTSNSLTQIVTVTSHTVLLCGSLKDTSVAPFYILYWVQKPRSSILHNINVDQCVSM